MFNFKELAVSIKNSYEKYMKDKKEQNKSPNQMRCIYICDGCNKLCGEHPEHCFRYGGTCTHTENINNSIKLKLGNKFPPTYFVKVQNDLIAEEINLEEFVNYFTE